MVLKRVDVCQSRAHAIGKAEPVPGGAVVVARGKSLDVQPSDAAGGENHAFGSHDHMPLIVEIFENRAGTVSVLVAKQLDRSAKLQEMNLLVEDFVLEDPHDLQARVIRARQEPRL